MKVGLSQSLLDMSKFHGLSLSPAMQNYISAVVDPFGSSEPAVIPDAMNDLSLCLKDQSENGTTTNVFDGDLHGALFWLTYGYNTLSTIATVPALVYTLNLIGLDENNYPILTSAGKYVSATSNNYVTITGSSTSVDIGTSLVSRIRQVASGLRILPTIETVTDPTQVFMSYIIGGQMPPSDLFAAIDNGSINIETMLRNTKGAKVFANKEGCTVRYDPFQTDFQLEMLMLDQAYSNTVRWDAVRAPMILAKFSQPVTTSSAMPLIVNAQWWFECGLKQPTPIYSEESPCDPNFDQIKAVMSYPCDDHPFVTKGHSFKKFNPNSAAFLRTLGVALKMSSHLPGLTFANVDKFMRASGKGFIAAAKIKKRKKKRKRSQRLRPRGRSRIRSYPVLSGERRPPRIRGQTPNYGRRVYQPSAPLWEDL
jgi:hypothetical protein